MRFFPSLAGARRADSDGKAEQYPLQMSSKLEYGHLQYQPGTLSHYTARLWTRNGQFFHIFFQLVWRWILTAALAGSVAGVLTAYQHKRILTTTDKHIFNFVITGLGIGIGANFAGALVHMAEKFRWRFLWRAKYPAKLFELVMHLDSQTKVWKLLWAAKRRWKIVLLCIFWLAINIGAQAAVALLGLTYEIDNPQDVNNYNTTEKIGTAAVTRLSFIDGFDTYGVRSVPKVRSKNSLNAQRSSANSYGHAAENFGAFKLDNSYIRPSSTEENSYFEYKKHQVVWMTAFVDFLPSLLHQISFDSSETLVTNRVLKILATCTSISKELITSDTIYGTPSQISFMDHGEKRQIEIQDNARNATTYISDSHRARNSRETRVLVFWQGLANNVQSEALYECYNTVYDVEDLYDPKRPISDDLQVPDEQARIIAGAIGWADWSSDRRFHTHTYGASTRWSFDAAQYPYTVANEFVSQFSIGVVNAMQNLGPRMLVQHVAYTTGGVVLVVKWQYTLPVLAGIAGVHALFLLCTLAMIYRIPVLDDGALATAQFLRPLLGNLPSGAGAMLSSKEIAERIDDRGNFTYSWFDHDELPEDGSNSSDGRPDRGPKIRYLRATTVPAIEQRKWPTMATFD